MVFKVDCLGNFVVICVVKLLMFFGMVVFVIYCEDNFVVLLLLKLEG